MTKTIKYWHVYHDHFEYILTFYKTFFYTIKLLGINIINGYSLPWPISPEYTGKPNGDSHFSLLTHDELQQVLDEINDLESQGKIKQYIKTRDQLRLQFGQVTFFIIKKMGQQ